MRCAWLSQVVLIRGLRGRSVGTHALGIDRRLPRWSLEPQFPGRTDKLEGTVAASRNHLSTYGGTELGICPLCCCFVTGYSSSAGYNCLLETGP